MKKHSVLEKLVLGCVLIAAVGMTSAGERRSFGYSGEVDSFDSTSRLLVVDDHVFQLTDDVRVYMKKGREGQLSSIRPGVKVGFYPGGRESGKHGTYIDAIWVLPASWKVKHDYSIELDR